MGHRHELTEDQWRRLEPLLPRARRGPQPCDLRRMVNGILWLDRTGTLAGPARALQPLAHGGQPLLPLAACRRLGSSAGLAASAGGPTGAAELGVAPHRYLQRRAIGAVIPRKANERRVPNCDRAAHRERNRVERLINRLKLFRRVATCYEKVAVSYLAMVTIAAVLMWL